MSSTTTANMQEIEQFQIQQYSRQKEVDEVDFLMELIAGAEVAEEESPFLHEALNKMTHPEMRPFTRKALRGALDQGELEDLREKFKEFKEEKVSIPRVRKEDPLRLLMEAIRKTEQGELDIQAATAKTMQKLAISSQHNLSAGSEILKKAAEDVHTAVQNGDDKEVRDAETQYNRLSQEISNVNNQLMATNKVVEGSVTGLSQSLAQALEYAKSVLENASALNNMLGRLGG